MDRKKPTIATAYVFACLIAAFVPFVPTGRELPLESQDFPGWPESLQGKPLTEMTLTPAEIRFLRQFPGKAAKFSDGSSEIILRWITEPSRRLHPAAECFRAAGYTIHPKAIWQDSADHQWNVFEASAHGKTLRIYERIFDHQGRQWPDVSSWYWSALMGRTQGPWWTITYVVRQQTNPRNM